jgi:hypothetical protein
VPDFAALPRLELAPAVWHTRRRQGGHRLRPRRRRRQRRDQGAGHLGECASPPARRCLDAEPARHDPRERRGELLVAIHGPSVEEDAPGHRRAILARVELATEAAPCRWLNTSFLVGEGEIDEAREDWLLDVYVCVNEQAQGPPALGAESPARFRQRGAASAP